MTSKVTVLYGTDTGNAQEAALFVVSELRKRGVTQILFDSIDAVDIEKWKSLEPIVFVCSTAGQGQVPRSMTKAWDILRMTDAPDLPELKYAVFGLGDSAYPKFNYAAKMLHNRLKQLGGAAIVHRGLGDDQDPGGYDEQLQPWLQNFFKTMSGIEEASLSSRQVPMLQCEVVEKDVVESTSVVRATATATLKILKNERLTTNDHFQAVHHMDLEKKELQYECGDSLAVFPKNSTEMVDRMLNILALSGKEIVIIRVNNESGIQRISLDSHFEKPISTRALFTTYLEISKIASRRFMRMLSTFAEDEEEAERLLELSQTEFLDEYNSYCHREKRNFVEVLEDFRNIKPPLDSIVDCIPVLQPRYFSIASSPHEDVISLTVAKLEFKTPYGRQRSGLCSTLMCDANVGDTLECFVSQGTLFLHQEQCPLVLIGPGTGIAPLRSIVRYAAHKSWSCPIVLVTGNRNREKDYLYGTEFMELAAKWDKFSIFSAFSRDSDTKVKYAQHLMATPTVAKVIGPLMESGSIYVCGNAKQMPADVEKTLSSIAHHFVTKGEDEGLGLQFLTKLKTQQRYQLEAWSP